MTLDSCHSSSAHRTTRRKSRVLLDCGYRLDLVVDRRILVEVKAVERLLPIHQAQTITYLKLAKLDTALLVNFNVSAIKFGLRRLTRKQISP